MYNLSINTTTPGELRDAIKSLAELFANECKPCSTKPEQKTKTLAPVPVAGSPALSAATPSIATAPAAEGTAAGSVTITQVRETVQALTTGNVANRDKVKAILAEYGAESVKTLDPQHFPEFLTKVKAIA
jgi:hypothetical protein